MRNANTELKYFLYARKSSESEDRQIQSIDDQISHLNRLAKQLGITIVHTYVEAKSAKAPYMRPIFMEMMQRIQRGDANAILCWQLNRLSRNPVDSGQLDWLRQSSIIKAIQTIDKVYLPDDNVLLFNVESGMANQYIIDLRKNSMRGMVGKAERGWIPSRPPLGYLNDKAERTICKDTERFELVRKIWDLMLTGCYRPSQIQKIANEQWGFRTPLCKRSGGTPLNVSTIYKMLTNIFYTGLFEWNGKIYQGNHMAMITMEEYDRVQYLLGNKGKPRPQQHEFAFTGMIRCGECGAMITATEKKKSLKRSGRDATYTYYHCTHKKRDIQCSQRSAVTAFQLERQIMKTMIRFTITPQFRSWAIEILHESNLVDTENLSKIKVMKKAAYEQAKKELETLIKMRYRELIDDETFIQEQNSLKKKIAQLQEDQSKTDNVGGANVELTESAFDYVTYGINGFNTGNLQQKKELFNCIGQNFSLVDKKLNIDKYKWISRIEMEYPELQAEYQRIELNKSITEEVRKLLYSQLFLRWRAIVKDVRDDIQNEALEFKIPMLEVYQNSENSQLDNNSHPPPI